MKSTEVSRVWCRQTLSMGRHARTASAVGSGGAYIEANHVPARSRCEGSSHRGGGADTQNRGKNDQSNRHDAENAEARNRDRMHEDWVGVHGWGGRGVNRLPDLGQRGAGVIMRPIERSSIIGEGEGKSAILRCGSRSVGMWGRLMAASRAVLAAGAVRRRRDKRAADTGDPWKGSGRLLGGSLPAGPPTTHNR